MIFCIILGGGGTTFFWWGCSKQSGGSTRFLVQKCIKFFILFFQQKKILFFFLLILKKKKNDFVFFRKRNLCFSLEYFKFFYSKVGVFSQKNVPHFWNKNKFLVKSCPLPLIRTPPPCKNTIKCSRSTTRKFVNFQAKSVQVYDPR